MKMISNVEKAVESYPLSYINIILSMIDLCVTLPCGLNAICDASIGDVKCSCPENMVGDPKIKCEGN